MRYFIVLCSLLGSLACAGDPPHVVLIFADDLGYSDLLGFKFGAWEGGHRVPFIARWPGRIDPGTTSDQLI